MGDASPRRGLDPDIESSPDVGGPRRAMPPTRGAEAPRNRLPFTRRGVLVLGAVVLVAAVGIAYAITAPHGSSPTNSASVPATRPTPTFAGTPVQLDDTTIVMPTGWEIYADQEVQDKRRLVRMRDPETDVRVQAVALTKVDEALPKACAALIEQQSGSFPDMTSTPAFTIPVAPGGEGYTCGFNGKSSKDDLEGRLTFTLIRRDADGHALVLRDFQPTGLVGSPEVTADLGQITCSASSGFEVSLTRCR